MKLGRLPFAVEAISVNWLITSRPPAASVTLRFILPASSGKIRICVTLPASQSASAGVSPASTPMSTSSPVPIRPTTSPPIVTLASLTRWITARMAKV